MKRLAEIEARKAEIRSLLQSEEKVDLEALKSELESLTAEKRSIEERQEIAQSIQVGSFQARTIVEKEENKLDENSAEYRSAFFKGLLDHNK